MALSAWIALGLVSGFLASKFINRSGDGLTFDIVLGIAGAVAGGWLSNTVGASGVHGLNFYSACVAVVGAVAALLAHHFLVRNAR